MLSETYVILAIAERDQMHLAFTKELYELDMPISLVTDPATISYCYCKVWPMLLISLWYLSFWSVMLESTDVSKFQWNNFFCRNTVPNTNAVIVHLKVKELWKFCFSSFNCKPFSQQEMFYHIILFLGTSIQLNIYLTQKESCSLLASLIFYEAPLMRTVFSA